MKKKISILLIALLTLVCIPVHAKDNFYVDQNLTLKEDITSTVFAAGNNVEVTGKNDGISFVAGNNVTVKNERDYLFAAGNTVTIENVTTKDAFVAGSIVAIEDSTVRDLYAIGEKLTINSAVTGNAYIGGDTVIINSTIKGNVTVAAETIKLGEKAVIEGTLKYPKGVSLDKDSKASIAKEKTYKNKEVNVRPSPKDIIIEFIVSALSMILIGLVLLLLNNKVFDKFADLDKSTSNIIKTILLGFGFLVLVPIAVLILLLSTIGLNLGLISIILYGIMFYLSAIPTAYFFGNWILKDKITNNYLLLVVSILALYIIRAIPIIGGIVSFLSLCFGLGTYTKLIKDNIDIK